MKKKFNKNIFIDKTFRREKFNLYNIYIMKKYVFDFQFKLAFAIKLKDHSLINSISINILFSSIVRHYAVYKVLKGNDYKLLTAKDLMSINPKSVDKEELAVVALDIIRKNNISQLLVTKEGAYFGMLHLHDLLQEGII